MSFVASKKAGYVLRVMSLAAFALMMISAAIVILESGEIAKIIPDSPARSMSIFFGYIVAIFSFNYGAALKGRNFMGWKAELLMVLGLFFLFAGIFFSNAFPTSEIIKNDSWIPFLSPEYINKPNYWFAVLSLFSLPLFVSAAKIIRKSKVWKEGDFS